MTSAVVHSGVSKEAVLYCFTCRRSVLSIGCYAFDLHKGILGEGLHCEGAAGRERLSEKFGVDSVHGYEIAHVSEQDGGLEDFVHSCPRLFEDRFDIHQRLPGLSLHSPFRE